MTSLPEPSDADADADAGAPPPLRRLRATGPAEVVGPPPRRLRASDADRAVVVRRLQQAVGQGLLTFDEGGERMSAAFAARYLDELPPLSSDLPPAPPVAPAVMGWRRLWELFGDQVRHELTTPGSSGVRSRRAIAALVVALVFLVLVVSAIGAATHGVGGGFDGHQHFGPHDFNGGP